MKDSQQLIMTDLDFWFDYLNERGLLLRNSDRFEIAIELTKLQYQKELNMKFPLEVDVCINQDNR